MCYKEEVTSIIVIPSRNENNIFDTLISLSQNINVNWEEVLVLCLINYTEADTISDCINGFSSDFEDKAFKYGLPYNCIISKPYKMIGKHAGVGHVRKILMDTAIDYFNKINRVGGIIINLDADCTVDKNYLGIIKNYYESSNSKSAVSIGFKHRFDGLSVEEIKACELYEYHLNDYIDKQRKYNYPFAFHTLGSCFAVKAEAYCEQGGMNQRQAGEDFYFLHKFSILNQLGEIKSPIVFPLGRKSDRVPFGTGRAITQIIGGDSWFMYNELAIELFCGLMEYACQCDFNNWELLISEYLSDKPVLIDFMHLNNMWGVLNSIGRNSASQESFSKSLSRFFDPFRLMKWLHFARNHGYLDEELTCCIEV